MSELLYNVETREEAIARVAHDAGSIAVGETIALHLKTIEAREYQIDTWSALDRTRAEHKDSALVHLATGLGKTTVGVIDSLKFIHEEQERTGKTPRILFTSHKKEINNQAAERFSEFAPALIQGRYEGREKNLDCEITFATLQSLYQNLDDIDPEHFDYIIFDEAHHSQAETFKAVVEHFKPAFKLALTATPDRMDEERIEELFGEPVYVKNLAEAMADGYLADVDYHIVFDVAIKKAMEDGFNPTTLKEIRDLLKNESRNEAIALQIKEEMQRIGLEDAKTIIFCQDVEQADEMADLLGGKPYHSGVESKDRDNTLQEFRSNGLQVITTRDMFNEGVDIPDARLVVFLRATSSRTIFEQQLGRGLRRSDTKDTVSVLDFVANIERLNQVKELIDSVSDYQQRQSSDHDTEIVDEESGLRIHSGHTDFDFDRISVSLLEKLSGLNMREFGNMTNEQLVELALTLSPDKPLTYEEIAALSKEGQFVSSGTIMSKFKNMRTFQEACGFDLSSPADLDDESLIEIALSLSPDKPLTKSQIESLSKSGEFASTSLIKKRFNSLREFQEACGFTSRKSFLGTTNDTLVENALELSPEKPLTKEDVDHLSKSGQFASYDTVLRRFKTMREFHAACGFKELNDYDNESLVELALSLSPEKALSTSELNKLAKNGDFVSSTIIYNKFGSVTEFQKACGFAAASPRKMDKDDIIALARDISPDAPLTKGEIDELSKSKEFVSAATIYKKFGSMPEFRKACGF